MKFHTPRPVKGWGEGGVGGGVGEKGVWGGEKGKERESSGKDIKTLMPTFKRYFQNIFGALYLKTTIMAGVEVERKIGG